MGAVTHNFVDAQCRHSRASAEGQEAGSSEGEGEGSGRTDSSTNRMFASAERKGEHGGNQYAMWTNCKLCGWRLLAIKEVNSFFELSRMPGRRHRQRR